MVLRKSWHLWHAQFIYWLHCGALRLGAPYVLCPFQSADFCVIIHEAPSSCIRTLALADLTLATRMPEMEVTLSTFHGIIGSIREFQLPLLHTWKESALFHRQQSGTRQASTCVPQHHRNEDIEHSGESSCPNPSKGKIFGRDRQSSRNTMSPRPW